MRLLLGLSLIIAAIGCGSVHDAVTVTIHSAAKAEIRGTGQPMTKTFPIAEFEKIRTSAAMHFVISQGKEPKLTISAQKEILDSLEPGVTSEELFIKTPKSFTSDREILVTVETPNLTAMTTQSASKVEATGNWSDEMKIHADEGSTLTLAAKAKSLRVETQGAARFSYSGPSLSSTEFRANGGSEIKISPDVDVKEIWLDGGSKLILGNVRGDSCRWDLNGGSSLSITGGSISQLDLVGNGGSRISVSGVSIQDAMVDLNGAAYADLTVKRSIRGSVNGAANLRYGSATAVDIRTAGAGQAVR